MKLSEIKGEKAVEVIADLIEPIANIAADQENLQLFRNKRQKGESDSELGLREIKEKIPNLLKTHKTDVLTILCAINGTDPNELSVFDVFKGAVELTNDKEFMSLFLSSVKPEDGTQPTESSANADHSEPEL